MKKTHNTRTKRSAIVAICLAGVILVSGAFAFLSDSESAINRFTFADKDGEQTVDVEINEPSWVEQDGKDILPLDTVRKDPEVTNVGENDVYSFVTVLVPTAKSIMLNKEDGSTYEANSVELFSYKVNDGWVEISATKFGAPIKEKNTTLNRTFTLENHLGETQVVELVGNSFVNGENVSVIKDLGANVYYTAHTYAYAASDTEMTKLEAGKTTPAVFESVTLINIADGARVYETFEEVEAKLIAKYGEAAVAVDADKREIVVTKDGAKNTFVERVEGEGENAYTVVVDSSANIQYKVLSQFTEEDNLNIYVDTYAIQADNVEGTIDEIWDICANANAKVEEGQKYTNEFYFEIINDDIGHKSALDAE